MHKILVINPGSTSTKIAVYEDEKQLFVQSLEHDRALLAPFENIIDQYELRRDLALGALKEHGVDPKDLAAVIGRGGILPPVNSGAYEVNQAMLDQLRFKPAGQHASNLGAIIAEAIAKIAGVKAYIYDPVTVDEMLPIVKITGLPQISRPAMAHNLNMRASALRYARENNLDYYKLSLVVAHLGGGSSLTLHQNGRIIDAMSDDEGPFSPERAGGLPGFKLIDLCVQMGCDAKAMQKLLRGQAGLYAWFGTTDARAVEGMIDQGDGKAALVYEAMALNIAKSIGKLAVVVDGRVDAIILTGGLAFSKRLTTWIEDKVKFIAPVIMMPGEKEMEALAQGALRVLRGEETARLYVSPDM
ncbi:MAG: butyrate kinase [Candidatus Adiutrix sp.]|jgi:butyrate kinase|nr:butyrate kinase [Candidatus Adiutrix sp.]